MVTGNLTKSNKITLQNNVFVGKLKRVTANNSYLEP